MAPLASGALVAWWHGARFDFGVVARCDDERVVLVGPGGREDRVPVTRVAFPVETVGPVPGSDPQARRAAGSRAEAAERQARQAAAQIDVPLVWELAFEDDQVASDEQIAELALGSRSGAARAAVIVALLLDGVRFVRKGDRWVPRERIAVEEILLQRERARQAVDEKRRVIDALTSAVQGGPFTASGSEWEVRCLDALVEVAVHEDDAAEDARRIAAEIVEAVAVAEDSLPAAAFVVSRRTGRFGSDDENLAIPRYRIRTEFPCEAVEAARRAAERGFVREGREDLTALEVVTIDGPSTREIDDGLSAEPLTGGRFLMGVHIADPAAFVEPDDAVDREAMQRAVSHYFPDRRIPMLPPVISEDAASLVEGSERPALSFLIEVDSRGAIAGLRVTRSIVRVRERLNYDEADAGSTGAGRWGALLRDLARLTESIEERRAASGAIRIAVPEVEPVVDADGRVRLVRREPGSHGQRIVSEAMVLAGEAAARLCLDRRVPALFRRQPPPEGSGAHASSPLTDLVAARAMRRTLRRGEASVHPGRHFALGLDAYVQVTSPLRRYQDLTMHRQIIATLDPCLPVRDLDGLQRIAAITERAEADGRRAERQADRYWLLRAIADGGPDPLDAVVVETVPRAIVILEDSLLEAPVPGLTGRVVGDRVRVRVRKVNPRADRISVRPETV